MPDEAITATDVQTALDYLLTYSLDYPKVRHQNYQFLLNAIHNDELDIESVKKLLKVCVQDISTTKYTTTIIKIILAISSKVKVGKYGPAPDMTPTALAVISMIKTLAPLSKVEALMTLCFDTLLAYPEITLIAMAEHHNDILEVFNLYCNLKIPIHIRLQACNLLLKLLKILPPEKKRVFVENGILIWFSKIIPYHMVHITSPLNDTQMTLEVLELLTEELVHIDYTHVPPWHGILECICNTKQYPAVLKKLLMSENDAWQRLWIVFIKLLKHQITQPQGEVGTPINSMLPVVETAFKLDVKNRCKAFECWNVLIDSFSTETNESNINKRIKLLIIPLKSNNAKHEETALAKFNCWWHLIRKFQNKMDKFLDIVLISFLNFCFGRHTDIDKASLTPGQISASLKTHCNQAIVDMIGHVNCEGCTKLPQLTGKLINTKRLVDNWNHWIYSITFVIMKTAKSDICLTKQQMTCVWKSFLMTIGELPENNIRKDLFSEILSIVNRFVQECKSNNQFLDIAFNILILSLFDEDTQIQQLFKSDSDANDPIVRIVSTILDSSLNRFYKSLPPTELMTKLKPVTKLIVNERVCTSIHIVNQLLDCFPSNDVALMLWNDLAESLRESKREKCMRVTHNLLIWPLKAIQNVTEVKIPAITWYTTYNEMYQKLNKTEIDKAITEMLLSTPDAPISNVFFKLCVVLAVLNQKFTEDTCGACEEEINHLLNLTKVMDSYNNFEQIFPMLVDRIVAIMTIVTTKVNDTVAALILVCVKNALHVLIQTCKQQTGGAQILFLIGNLLEPLENLFAVEAYSKLIPAMTYHLLKCSHVLCTDPSTEKIILSIMKTILSKIPTTDTNYNMIKVLIEDIQNNTTKKKVLKPDQCSLINNFPTPQAKEVPKRVKTKEASIVNTVVENGEEYVVVKSNWKFNPRNLTENQKEKLQRKREDIPALYQDLSQSQDEFKLVAWKTDSQDTTSSSRSESRSSKPGDNDTATEILKNIPNTDVVPKILENIRSENEKKSEESNAKDSVITKDNLSIKNFSTPSPKNTKSPRMALKDRVFRNVRNLMESSGLQKENKETNEDPNKTATILKTPTNSKNNNSAHLANSAPPLLSADRPSRVKRKPKKFEDLALLTTKKRRFSQQDSQKEHSSDSGQESNEKDCSDIATIQSIGENKEKTNGLPETSNYVDKAVDFKDDDKSMQFTDGKSNKTNENRETGTGSKKVLSSESAKVMADDEKIASEQSVKDVINVDSPMDMDTEVSAPILSANNEEEVATTNVSKDLKEVITPKMTRASSKEIVNVTSTATKDATTPKASIVKEVLTPKTKKVVKEVATPKQSEAANETASIVSNVNNGATTPKISKHKTDATPKAQDKEVPTHKTTKAGKKNSLIASKDGKEIASSKVSKVVIIPMSVTPKDLKEDATPKSSTDLKEASTPKRMDKYVSSSNLSKTGQEANVGISKNVKETASDITKEVIEASALKASKDGKEVSTPKMSNVKEISTPKSIKQAKDVPSPIISKDVKTAPKLLENVVVMLNYEPNKNNQDLPTPKNISELKTPQAVKELRETRSSKSPKDMKEETINLSKEVSTPKQPPKADEQKSTTKKVKKSRIEKELAIDMVEGHPFLKNQTEKRLTRKTLESAATGRRKSLAGKLNKSKSETNSTKKTKDKNKESENTSASVVVDESQEKDSEPKENNSFSDDLPYSDDVIESSQVSTITTISVKSTRKTPKKVAVVCVEKITKPCSKTDIDSSQSILEPPTVNISKPSTHHESKDDSVLPVNKTAVEEITQADLTENMDTEPIDDNDVVLVIADIPAITVCASEDTVIGPETQEIAEADTQPTEPTEFMDLTHDDIPGTTEKSTEVATHIAKDNELQCIPDNQNETDKTMDIVNSTANNTTIPLTEAARAIIEQAGGVSSPFKDEAQRQKDFLNNTIEISPIKTMSPERRKKSPSPETSSDYVVIKLTSPVHSNGEPFEKCSSPEVFTEDKVSPDRRDQSPPRVEITAAVTSPSSSLSLKKNRPQVRSGGRAAQMLGLCVPDRVQAIVNPERSESEEVKKSSTNTPARRNLRILYNTVNDNTDSSNSNNTSENDDSANFLKFRRTLPTVDSSPSGPILKRKLVEITDDATVSPASKRKRVSFHDPPVSTTISVQKYIEPIGVRSPQNSAVKRLERQMRQHTPKSPKRLENAFKLDTALTKTVESFTGSEVIIIPDNEQTQQSLDETPVVEIVRASELNDTDPICPELLDCKDPISNIAGELSSSAMKTLLIKELEGKIETVGDLAKMTELEVNRLCIKAPKVKVAKKVLTEYITKRVVSAEPEISETINAAEFDEPMAVSEAKVKDMEVQTHRDEMDVEVQTVATPTRVFSVQTEIAPTAHTSIQTIESGSKSTADIIKSCLVEKPDFVEQLGEQLEESSIQKISEKLPFSAITDLLMKKISPSDTKDILNRIFERNNSSNDRSKELPFIRDYLCGRFGSNDLVLLCSQILKVVHDRST